MLVHLFLCVVAVLAQPYGYGYNGYGYGGGGGLFGGNGLFGGGNGVGDLLTLSLLTGRRPTPSPASATNNVLSYLVLNKISNGGPLTGGLNTYGEDPAKKAVILSGLAQGTVSPLTAVALSNNPGATATDGLVASALGNNALSTLLVLGQQPGTSLTGGQSIFGGYGGSIGNGGIVPALIASDAIGNSGLGSLLALSALTNNGGGGGGLFGNSYLFGNNGGYNNGYNNGYYNNGYNNGFNGGFASAPYGAVGSATVFPATTVVGGTTVYPATTVASGAYSFPATAAASYTVPAVATAAPYYPATAYSAPYTGSYNSAGNLVSNIASNLNNIF